MSLSDKLEIDLATAMKSREPELVSVLRLLKSALHNERIKAGHTLNELEELAILSKEAKQRRQSIEAFIQGGRAELAASEQAELEIISRYLPAELDEASLGKMVDTAIAEVGADPAKMGQIIGMVVKQSRGQADGQKVAALVKEKLNNAAT